ncbi:MAG: YbbR-like domain-containing protein [candidate division NC10 bacterium]|nr:YbbR-like domain-containing protein [candidate division NC10 bacterium]
MRRWALNNLELKLLSVFLAVLLWAVVLGEQKIEVSVGLPLELKIPADLVPVSSVPESLEVTLRGPRTLVRSAVPHEVALLELLPALREGENLLPVNPEIVRVPRGIVVVNVVPSRLRVVLERLVEQEIDVTPRIEGAPLQGYLVRQVTPVPPRVTLVGPASEFKKLRRLHTLPVNVQGRSDSFTARVQVEPPGGQIRLREGSVDVRVDIGPAKS